MRQPEELYELDQAALSQAGDSLSGAAFLVHLEGFMDAGSAGRLVTEHLLDELSDTVIARFDTDRLLDYRSRRPLMTFDKTRWESYDDPRLEVHLLRTGDGKPVTLLTGPELSFLKPVWHDEHWQLWELRDPTPLTRGPVTLRALDVNKVDLDASAAGSSTVLVRWTRFWRVTGGVACVAPTPDGWTQVVTFGPGPVQISAQVGLGSLAGGGGGGSCSAGTHP